MKANNPIYIGNLKPSEALEKAVKEERYEDAAKIRDGQYVSSKAIWDAMKINEEAEKISRRFDLLQDEVKKSIEKAFAIKDTRDWTNKVVTSIDNKQYENLYGTKTHFEVTLALTDLDVMELLPSKRKFYVFFNTYYCELTKIKYVPLSDSHYEVTLKIV